MKNKRLKNAVLLLLLFVVSGCSVQLVSQYDERTETSVSNIRTQLTRLFFELEAQAGKQPQCTYENHSEKYKQLRVDLDLIAMRERTKFKNETTSKQVEVLDEGLKMLQKSHQKSCLNKLQVTMMNQSLTRMLDSILRFEVAKLRGARKTNTLTTVR